MCQYNFTGERGGGNPREYVYADTGTSVFFSEFKRNRMFSCVDVFMDIDIHYTYVNR